MKLNLSHLTLSLLAVLILFAQPSWAAKTMYHKPTKVVAKTPVRTAVVQKASPVSVSPAIPADSAAALADIEQSVFRRTYSADKLESRLSRLESFLYGETRSTQTTGLRLKALRETVPPLNPQRLASPVIAQQPSVSSGSQQQIIIQPNAPEEDHTAWSSDDPALAHAPPQAPAPAEFTPQVLQGMDSVEQKVYGRSYSQDAPDTRMSRLEMRLFNATAPEMEPEERLYRVASILKAQESSQEEKVAGNGFLPSPNARNNGMYGSGNGVFINGMPMSPNSGGFYGGAFGVGGGGRSGVSFGTRGGGNNRILPSLLMILLQSLL